MLKRRSTRDAVHDVPYAPLALYANWTSLQSAVRFFVLATFLVPMFAHAEADIQPPQPSTATPTSVAPTPEQLHDGLRALKATMEKALNAMDIETVVNNVTEDVVFTTMNGDVARGRDGIKKYFETMMKGPNPRVTSVRAKFEADDLSHLYGNDVAVSFGSSKDQYTLASGESLAVDARWSGTMVRRDGRWLIANFHYSTNMFDNPVLQAQRKLLLIGAAAASVIAALLAFFVGRARGRKLGK